ncbi:MAG: ATP-dependent RecD-like DNA helicase [Firmicutes bacterium]|nr:ATP-dependent RecD-like DNA helicase [Bacillota bacterium]
MATIRVRACAEKYLLQREDGFAVLRVRLANDEALLAVGRLCALEVGDCADFLGRYEYHAMYGRQLRVDSFVRIPATSQEGMVRLLASGRFKGVGPKTARRIVDHFGADTLDMVRSRPRDVLKVPGIGRKRLEQIAAAFVEHGNVVRLGSFLRSHDLPMHLADKLAKAYGGGAAALAVLQENPYQTVGDVHGIGFRTADAIARALGVEANAPERMVAALIHTLDAAQDDGHMCLPFDGWIERATALLGVSRDLVAQAAKGMADRGTVLLEQGAADGLVVFSPRMRRIEELIAGRVEQLVRSQLVAVEESGLDASAVAQLTEEQMRVAQAVIDYPLVILTGGPGTGKTTTVRAVLARAHACGLKASLAAPTGRAAKRLAESTGVTAQTLHRLLEVGAEGRGAHRFARNRQRPLACDLLIVDEASMIDAPLFASLLEALPDGVRLLLVGDPAQLPAVGPGTVLRDLMSSQVAPVFELRHIFRQGDRSGIVYAAHEALCGRVYTGKADSSDFYFIEREDPAQVAKLVVELAVERLPKYLGVDAVTGVQVLTPMRRGLCGSEHLNELFSERFTSPGGPSLTSGGRVFRVGDKVMNIRNDYDRDIFNGDIGTVTDIGAEGLSVLFAELDGTRRVTLDKSELAGLVLAYAISVHKSQGSEYPCVVLPLVREHAIMLYRQLLYTGMTRARRLLVVVGSQRAFATAVSKVDSSLRYGCLEMRLRRESVS